MSTPPASAAAPPARPVGSIVGGRYQIEALLGQGSMGDVYLVKHTVMRKRLALKLLRPELSRVAEFAARFEREAMAAANIDHPHVAAATDCGKTEDGTLFLALEYIEGASLRQTLQHGALPLTRALHIAQQIGSAMVRAHELGIVHRDLKPENIMLTRREGDPDFVKVLDFGLAKLSSGSTPGDQNATVQKLTQFGEIFGTPQYMAPEQTTGGEADGRADLYALGIILFEMLTGVLPFEGKDIADFLRHQLATPLPPIQQRAPQITVPSEIEALLRRLCEKQPEERFQNADQFLEALEAAVQLHQLVLVPPKARSSSPNVRNAPGAPLLISNSQPQSLSGPNAISSPGSPALPVGASSSGGPAAVPQTASIVMFLNVVGRAQKRLPGPLQKVSPEKLATLLGLLGLLVFGGIFVVIWVAGSDDAPTAKKAQTSAEEGPTPEEIQAAAAQGVPGLQQLAQRHPNTPELLRTLALAQIQQGQADPAMTTLGQLARKSPQSIDEPAIMQFLSSQLLNPQEEAAAAAARSLERDFGDRGVDLLIQSAERVSPRLRARFNTSISNMRTRADLAPATRALLELRLAPKCEQKRAALLRVRQDGDVRSLPLLYALQTTVTGCAPFGLGDCWACLRQSPDLEDTIKAVISRPTRTPSGPAAPVH